MHLSHYGHKDQIFLDFISKNKALNQQQEPKIKQKFILPEGSKT